MSRFQLAVQVAVVDEATRMRVSNDPLQVVWFDPDASAADFYAMVSRSSGA